MAITVTLVSPNTIPAASSRPITLGGTGFLTVTDVAMYMGADGPGGAVPCAFTVQSDTSMVVQSFAAPRAGSGVIRLNPGAYLTGITISVAAPQITSVTPETGNVGDVVTLAGAFLDTVTAVSIGGIPVAISSQSPSSLVFTVPPNLGPGAQAIAVLNPGGSGQAVFTIAGPPAPVPCSRRAWLTLGDLVMPLEDETQGYYLTQLDLGFPTPREYVDDRPDNDGATDRTAYGSSRVVSANVVALASAGAEIDAVAAMFGPFMAAGARPTLHYVLERPGASERTMVVRGSGYSWLLEGAQRREVQLQWVAADGIAHDVTVRTATAWAGSSTIAGRTYPLTFPRVYPAGGGSPSIGLIVPGGDVVARPRFRIYGPVTGPDLAIRLDTTVVEELRFAASFSIAAGHYVDADSHRRTIVDDTGASIYGSVLWGQSTWGALSPGSSYAMSLSGGTTTGSTQAVATWQDGYLS